MLVFINASSSTVPLVFVLSRVQKASLGLTNPCGWIRKENFFKFTIHFAKYVKPIEETRCLILCEDHSSHITIDFVTFASDDHITILTFPPHCSHRLQPLDVSFYGSFEARYRRPRMHGCYLIPERQYRFMK